MDSGIRKYVDRYIEGEARTLPPLGRRYDHVLVVPACGESPGLLAGFEDAARSAKGSVLCVLVVNGRIDAPTDIHTQNEALVSAVLAESRRHRLITDQPRIILAARGAYDVLLVDRASVGARFSPRQGVGVARKVGFDLALTLWLREEGPVVVHTTDADARLCPDHFAHRSGTDGRDVSVWIYPFEHVSGGDAAVFERTRLYELYLRYWVAGLSHAGSPYAFHTLGSTLAVSLPHYVRVRGVPNRLAGEDFYLVNKLAKLAPVLRPECGAVRLTARDSSRTPFGTGAAVRRLDGGSLLLPAAGRFEVLGQVLGALDDLSEHADTSRFTEQLGTLGLRGSPLQSVASQRHLKSLSGICDGSHDPRDRRRRLHCWFDGFRTLKLLRSLDEMFPRAPWQEVMSAAQFVPGEPTNVGVALQVLSNLEKRCATRIGPSLRGRENVSDRHR